MRAAVLGFGSGEGRGMKWGRLRFDPLSQFANNESEINGFLSLILDTSSRPKGKI